MKTSARVVMFLTIAALSAGALIGAPPATAFISDVNVVLVCERDDITIYANVGDRVGFTFDASCTDDPALNPFFWNANEAASSPSGPGFFDSPSATTGTCSHSCGTSPEDWYTYETDYDAVGATLLSSSNGLPLTVGSVIAVAGWRDEILARNVYVPIYWVGSRSASSGGMSPEPESFTLTWNPGEDAACANASTTAKATTWIQVPKTDQCTASGTHTGATLLGWSTSADFPVALAQEAVTRAWTAIDQAIEGARMVFIPAGGYTCVTGSNTLYAIWST